MKVIGIVGEYNPFHNGHLHHIEESRAIIGEDAAVLCVMSGDYVQRGEPAMFSKFARAEAAVRCGASLVLELPLPWCLSSAEGFCRGAVGLLGATGVVDYLSFGSEAGSIDPLSALAIAIMNPGLDEQIRKELETGISYAAARQHALESELGELAKHLEKPNNILAVEYLRALYELRLPMMPMTVVRTGAGHDQKGEGSLRSASELRSLLHTGHDVSAFIPAPTVDVFQREMRMGRGPMPNPALETAILSRLRAYDEHLFENIPDASEGLDNRLRTAARSEPTLDTVAAAAKSKRYALARLRRMIFCAALGVKRGMTDDTPPYARVLAADSRGRELLRRMSERSGIPVITKPTAVRELPPEARRIFELGCAAHDLYVLGYSNVDERRGGGDWRATPFILSEETSSETPKKGKLPRVLNP